MGEPPTTSCWGRPACRPSNAQSQQHGASDAFARAPFPGCGAERPKAPGRHARYRAGPSRRIGDRRVRCEQSGPLATSLPQPFPHGARDDDGNRLQPRVVPLAMKELTMITATRLTLVAIALAATV